MTAFQASTTQPPAPGARAAPPLVTVIIVNFNGGSMICDCLAALERQHCRNFETVVVDNASSDDSVSLIRKKHPNVSIIKLTNNAGFAGGVNHALKTCALGTWVALLNPDAFPAEDWLANLLASAQNTPDFAAFGSRMFSDPQHTLLDGVGDAYHVSGLPWRKGHGRPNSAQYDQEQEIFAPCAAAALYRVSALQEIGLMDEDLFLYVEDVDLGFRLRLAGHRTLYVPTATLRHVGSAFVGRRSEAQIYYGHRNLVWVYVKNMPGLLFWIFLPVHLALNIATVLAFALRGHARVIWRAKRDALYGLSHYWTKRRAIQSARKASLWSILRQLHWNPFRRN